MGEEVIDVPRLISRLTAYAEQYGVPQALSSGLQAIICSQAVQELLHLPGPEWDGLLVNDLYKAKMHRMISKYCTGVTAEFALNVRRARLSLRQMKEEHPGLFESLVLDVRALENVEPYCPHVVDVLERYSGFHTSEVRASQPQPHRCTATATRP